MTTVKISPFEHTLADDAAAGRPFPQRQIVVRTHKAAEWDRWMHDVQTYWLAVAQHWLDLAREVAGQPIASEAIADSEEAMTKALHVRDVMRPTLENIAETGGVDR